VTPVEDARQESVRRSEEAPTKRLALICANDVTAPDAGSGVDTNRITILFEESGWRRAVQGHEQTDLVMDALSRHPEKLGILVSQYSALIQSAPCPSTEGFAALAEFAAFLYCGIGWQRFHTSIRIQ